MSEALSYTNNGGGIHTVWRDGNPIGTVRKRGMYYLPYTTAGRPVHGTFMSMSAAGARLAAETPERGTR